MNQIKVNVSPKSEENSGETKAILFDKKKNALHSIHPLHWFLLRANCVGNWMKWTKTEYRNYYVFVDRLSFWNTHFQISISWKASHFSKCLFITFAHIAWFTLELFWYIFWCNVYTPCVLIEVAIAAAKKDLFRDCVLSHSSVTVSLWRHSYSYSYSI